MQKCIYQKYINNPTEFQRFAHILSGKADFKRNIIYLRDLTAEGKFEISSEISIKIKREEHNFANVRIRPNQEIPNQILDIKA